MTKLNKYVVPLMVSLLLLGCGNQASVAPPNSAAVSPVDAYVPLKGTYFYGEGVEAFTPCGQDKDYRVFTYTDEMFEQLKSEHQKLSTEPYGGIYVEINGVLGPRLHPIVGGEYAADYDGHVVVESVDVIRAKTEADCKS